MSPADRIAYVAALRASAPWSSRGKARRVWLVDVMGMSRDDATAEVALWECATVGRSFGPAF